MYDQGTWPLLGQGLALADAGNGLILQLLAENLGQRAPDGRYTNFVDANIVITANDAAWPRADAPYRLLLERLLTKAPHFAQPFALLAAEHRGLSEDAYRGPVTNPRWAPPALVVGGTGDAAATTVALISPKGGVGKTRLPQFVGI